MPTVVAEPKNVNEISFKQRELDLKAQERAEAEELKNARKSPFSRFYQVNKDNSEYLRSCLKRTQKHLKYCFLYSTTWINTMLLYVLTRCFKKR